MRRRAVVAALVSGLAGCLDGIGVGGDREAVSLSWIGLANRHPEPQRVTVRVRRDGEGVHRATYSVDGFDEDENAPGIAVVPCAWSAAAGEFAVGARVGGEWTELAPEELRRDGAACVGVRFRVRADRTVVPWLSAADCGTIRSMAGACEVPSPTPTSTPSPDE